MQKTKDDSIGFPRGIKEQIVLSCMQKYQKYDKIQETASPTAMDDDEPPMAVEEVEIASSETIDDEELPPATVELPANYELQDSQDLPKKPSVEVSFTENEYKNGSVYDQYCWSQTLKDVEVTVLLPAEVITAKHVKLNLSSTHISIVSLVPFTMELLSGDTWDRYKHNDVVWTIDDGKLTLSFGNILKF